VNLELEFWIGVWNWSLELEFGIGRSDVKGSGQNTVVIKLSWHEF
jgi:hypothetical protein